MEPYGASVLGSMPLETLWRATAAGNRKAPYHSHLCASVEDDAWHFGAGVSMTCAALVQAIEHLQQDHVKQLLRQELYDKAMGEAKQLLPHLQVLNFGKGSQGQMAAKESMSSLKKRRVEANAGPAPAEGVIREAAQTLHDWLSQEQSALRGLLSILAANNTFYTGFAAEKVARTCIHHKPCGRADFVKGALARAASNKPQEIVAGGAGDAEARGLFEEQQV